ncbi:P-loop containing nucleoside triphosphate hydrolase protein [Mycena floridula]|nr:P-loop containing nucleoside triphosphate hydrolase protein [Mycena floridula]
MAKTKKKTQLKPVVRGFATTSVPKKVIPEDEPVSVDAVPEISSFNSEEERPQDSGSGAQPDIVDPDRLLEQDLQDLVDKLQERTEKEIVRTVKAIEVDRRYSKTLPRLELDPVLVAKVLSLAESDPIDAKKLSLDEPEDKAIARLAITYGVLRRLGFSEATVEECLRAIPGVDLDDAYDWLYTHCSEEELKPTLGVQEINSPSSPKGNIAQAPRTPRTPRTPAEFLAPPTPVTPQRRLDAGAPVFVPFMAVQEKLVQDDQVLDEHAELKHRILAGLERDESTPPESDTDVSDGEHPNAEYARLKVKLDELLTSGKRDLIAEVQQVRYRLAVVKQNRFFDKEEADACYELECEHKARLLHRESDATPAISLTSGSSKKRPPDIQAQPPEESLPVADFFDDEIEGGLLGLLEEMPRTEVSANNTIIQVRDMSLPKHWSGRTPKKLLAESVAKVDRYAAITFGIISGASRAKRASVRVRWNHSLDEWSMDDVACYDDGQAEQYIATIALHSLAYPTTEGFAAATAASIGGPTSFRLLPPVFRDLWDELEVARKAREDCINRGIWAKLRSIVEPKLESIAKGNGKHCKSSTEAKDSSLPKSTSHSINHSEQLMAGFQARQSSPGYQEMLTHRNTLPIARYRNEILETLERSQVLVLSGETGCGKSTQVPTFLLEDQLSQGRPCKIYCTEPRRISAISLAQRVSRELGDGPNALGTLSSLVGYSIRLESNTSRNTRLTFVTNGIALRMLEGGTGTGGQGTAFDEITHIIIDEVHERTIESDFLLIVLKSLLEQRSDLKVILMSATLDADRVSQFFGGCPRQTLHVPGRTFPVEVQYLEDAVEAVGWTITENSPYARRQHDKFYNSKNRVDWSEDLMAPDDDEPDAVQESVKLEKRYSSATAATINLFDERLIPYDLIIRLLEKICFEDAAYLPFSAAVLVFMPGLGEIRKLNDLLMEHTAFQNQNQFKIYPLHSSIENQGAVFDIPPFGVRKLVIATNIAETGITIPDITCVIDSGKHREMRFDEKRQLSRLVETFISRSNAAQRRGRAGRVQQGLCFHLFTKLRHDTQMVDHPLPEMLRLSLSDLALRIKIMKVKLGSSIEDVLSRAMDPPASINVQRAISMLVEVRALTPTEEITPMGRLLSKLPTDVHLGKFLLIACCLRCLDPALTIAAALNSKSPFVTAFEEADRAKVSFRLDNSDFMTIHNAFASWRRASANPGVVRKFCRANFLSQQNLQQIEELRQQFLGYLIDSSFIQADKSFIRELSRARYGRHRNRFVPVPPEFDCNSGNLALLNAALAAGLYPKILAIDPINGQMRTISNNQQVSFHPTSVNFGRKPTDIGAHYLSYFTLMHSRKLYAWETGPVDDLALVLLCGESEIKLISDTVFIDRKVKFQIGPKSNIALKYLRSQIATMLANQFRGKPLLESQVLWNELAWTVLGKMKVDDEDAAQDIVV